VADGEARGRREVVDGVGLGRQDLAGGQGGLVGFQVALRVRGVQGVLPDLGGVGVAEGVQVEVGVLGEEEGCLLVLGGVGDTRGYGGVKGRGGLTGLLVERLGRHLDVPG
jgi:hypothetical protein